MGEETRFVEMLLDEARIATRLNHANIVQTVEVGSVDGRYFIVMEYLAGQSLRRTIRTLKSERGTGLSPALSGCVVLQVLQALDYAHNLRGFDGSSLHLIHRDVTPSNVVLTYDGQVKLLDFGIAKAVLRWQQQTQAGIVKGKLRYMAPEQAAGGTIDHRADLYSVGVMLWQLLTGQQLWKELDSINFLRRLGRGPIEALSTINPEIPASLSGVCERALAFDREERYGSASEFMNDLEDALTTASLLATPRQVGQLVSELFESERLGTNHIIESQIARIKSLSSPEDEELAQIDGLRSAKSHSATSLTPNYTSEPPTRLMPSDVLGDPRPTPLPVGDDSDTALSTALMPPQSLLSKARKPILLLALAVCCAALVAVVVTRMRPLDGAPTAASEQTAPPPRQLKLTVQTTPPTAEVSIDGADFVPAPHVGVYPADGKKHQLRVRAAGYLETVQELTFERDFLLDITLRRAPLEAEDSEAEERAEP
jgi:serine/threonine-protein kinase